MEHILYIRKNTDVNSPAATPKKKCTKEKAKEEKFEQVNYLKPQACKHAYNSCSKLTKLYSAVRFPITQVFSLKYQKSLNAIAKTIYERRANPTVYKIPFKKFSEQYSASEFEASYRNRLFLSHGLQGGNAPDTISFL